MEKKWSTRDTKAFLILKNLKQYEVLEMLFEPM